MAETLAAQWRTKLHTLPSGRQVRLRRFNPEAARDLVGDLVEPFAAAAANGQEALDSAIVNVIRDDPERFARVVAFFLQNGVAEPRIVPKMQISDLAEDEIRFQDIGEDLPALLDAIMEFNELRLPPGIRTAQEAAQVTGDGSR